MQPKKRFDNLIRAILEINRGGGLFLCVVVTAVLLFSKSTAFLLDFTAEQSHL